MQSDDNGASATVRYSPACRTLLDHDDHGADLRVGAIPRRANAVAGWAATIAARRAQKAATSAVTWMQHASPSYRALRLWRLISCRCRCLVGVLQLVVLCLGQRPRVGVAALAASVARGIHPATMGAALLVGVAPVVRAASCMLPHCLAPLLVSYALDTLPAIYSAIFLLPDPPPSGQTSGFTTRARMTDCFVLSPTTCLLPPLHTQQPPYLLPIYLSSLILPALPVIPSRHFSSSSSGVVRRGHFSMRNRFPFLARGEKQTPTRENRRAVWTGSRLCTAMLPRWGRCAIVRRH